MPFIVRLRNGLGRVPDNIACDFKRVPMNLKVLNRHEKERGYRL